MKVVKSFRITIEMFSLASLALALMPVAVSAQPVRPDLLPQQQQSQQSQPQQQQQFALRFVRDPDPAPELKVKDLDGKDLNLNAYKGKVVLLNFWATWC